MDNSHYWHQVAISGIIFMDTCGETHLHKQELFTRLAAQREIVCRRERECRVVFLCVCVFATQNSNIVDMHFFGHHHDAFLQ